MQKHYYLSLQISHRLQRQTCPRSVVINQVPEIWNRQNYFHFFFSSFGKSRYNAKSLSNKMRSTIHHRS